MLFSLAFPKRPLDSYSLFKMLLLEFRKKEEKRAQYTSSQVFTMASNYTQKFRLGPRQISKMFDEYKPGGSLRSAGAGKLVVLRSKTKQGEMALRLCAAHCWNQLHMEMCQMCLNCCQL